MNVLMHTAIVFVIFALNTTLACAASEWVAVEPPINSNAEKSAEIQGGEGDRLYIVNPGDTLRTIASSETGSSDNWRALALYNQLSVSSSNLTEAIILIPESLLIERPSVKQVNYEIREFDPTDSQPIAAPPIIPVIPNVTGSGFNVDKQPGTENRVVSKKIDMFAGEVRVLARVKVTRVAIGNGKIIRAEVLKTGELLVIAQTAGSSSLRLWNSNNTQSDFNIRVSETDTETRFPMEKMVQMKVKMVEFRKSALGKLGIDWSDSASGPSFATAGDLIGNNLFRPATEGFTGLPGIVKPFSTHFGIASNITSRINFMATNGDAVTLAEPVLSCANGGNAQFLAGGEVPYPTVGSNGQTTVDFKEYGIRLDISPQIDNDGNVRARIETEISHLDTAVTVQGAPGLKTRRTQTQVNVRSGETIVISGLLSSETGKDIDKLPGLGNLPVLGALFKSKNMRNSVTELVIFVTPEVIDPSANRLSERNFQIHEKTEQALAISRSGLQLLD